MDLKVLIVAEYYPRADDPINGIWAHRQALATAAAGAEVRVLVLHRPIPPVSALRAADTARALSVLRQPRNARLDGLEIAYVRYLSPPRAWSYRSWGAWAAPALSRALGRVKQQFPFDLVHAHYAVPAGDSVRRAAPHTPLVVSVHGHDVHGPDAGVANVRATLAHARLTIANSSGTAARCTRFGARATEVVHLGTDVPAEPRPEPSIPTLLTTGNLIARKRHADVLRALARLAARWPELRYVIVGDGPERQRLHELAATLGVADRVRFRGALPHREALATARQATLFVLPSEQEAFGVAYIEAMADGVPAVGARGEDGPEEIAAAGGGIVLTDPGNPEALAATIDRLLRDKPELEALGRAARASVEHEFTWERCGRATVAAYEQALSAR